MKKLIINADDFGYSNIFNKSILDLLKEKSIYSTTVMVNWITDNQKDQVVDLIRIFQHGRASVGLHIEKVSDNLSNDIESQIDKFKEIFSFMPTHFDIHKPARTEAECRTYTEACKKYDVPCRFVSRDCEYQYVTDYPAINGSDISVDDIENTLANMEDGKIYEILFHPGTYDHDCKSSLNKDRELDIVKIHKINELAEKYDISIISFADVLNN